MSSLINAGEGVDVDLHLHREIRGKTIDRVAQRIRLNRTKLRELQDTSTDYEELAGSIQAGYYIKQGLSSRNEDLFYMSVLITISAPTYEELQWRKQQMSDLMKSMDIQVGDCLFQQEAALRSTSILVWSASPNEMCLLQARPRPICSPVLNCLMTMAFSWVLTGITIRCVLSIHLIQKSIRMPILLSAGHLAPVRPLPCR